MSLLLEGVSLTVAIRAVRAGAEAAGLTFLEFVRRGMDPTSIAVMMEDSGAVAGLCIAGAPACTQLSRGIARRAALRAGGPVLLQNCVACLLAASFRACYRVAIGGC
jgi:zinc transporter 9